MSNSTPSERLPFVVLLFVAVTAVAAACGDTEPPPEPTAAEVLAAWTAAGLGEDEAECVLDLLPDEYDAAERIELAADPGEAAGDLVDACRQAFAPASTTTTTTPSDPDQPQAYGDDPALDALWDRCEAGEGEACDELFERAPLGSDYEEFGLTCGERDAVADCASLGAGDDDSEE